MAGAAWAATLIVCHNTTCYGTDRDDVRGTRLHDRILAKDGGDLARGLDGDDRLLLGGAGDDRLVAGREGMVSLADSDVEIGGAKNDVINIGEEENPGSPLPGAPVTPDRPYGGAPRDVVGSDDGQWASWTADRTPRTEATMSPSTAAWTKCSTVRNRTRAGEGVLRVKRA